MDDFSTAVGTLKNIILYTGKNATKTVMLGAIIKFFEVRALISNNIQVVSGIRTSNKVYIPGPNYNIVQVRSKVCAFFVFSFLLINVRNIDNILLLVLLSGLCSTFKNLHNQSSNEFRICI